jgi:hypothetical protein
MRPIRALLSCLILMIGFLAPHFPGLRAQDEPSGRDQEGRQESPSDAGPLAMTRAVACKSIEGYEDYEALPRGELTAEEKLLVYYRPLKYKIVRTSKDYTAHLTQDGQIRRKGEKTVLLRKKNLLDYEAKKAEPLGEIYLRNSFSLKGLAPGDYEYDIILRDENNPGPPVTQSVKFRVIPPILPKEE